MIFSTVALGLAAAAAAVFSLHLALFKHRDDTKTDSQPMDPEIAQMHFEAVLADLLWMR